MKFWQTSDPEEYAREVLAGHEHVQLVDPAPSWAERDDDYNVFEENQLFNEGYE